MKVKTKTSGSSKLILVTVVDEFFEKKKMPIRQHSVPVRKEMHHMRSGRLSPARGAHPQCLAPAAVKCSPSR